MHIDETSYPYNLLCKAFRSNKNITYTENLAEAFDFVLSTLSARERDYIRLRYIEGKSVKEIAPIFGLASPQSVRNLESKMILRIRHVSRRKYLIKGLLGQ